MDKVKLKIRYEMKASKNRMHRTWNGWILRREAKEWRDELIEMVKPYAGKFGLTAKLTFQIISCGGKYGARGDTQNFTELGCDAIAKGLGLKTDTHFEVVSKPRVKKDVPESYIEIILEEGENTYGLSSMQK